MLQQSRKVENAGLQHRMQNKNEVFWPHRGSNSRPHSGWCEQSEVYTMEPMTSFELDLKDIPKTTIARVLLNFD